MKSPTNYSLTNHVYIYLNECKRIIDVKLLLLQSNTWDNVTVCNQTITSK